MGKNVNRAVSRTMNGRSVNRNEYYIEGSAARKLDVTPQRSRQRRQAQRNSASSYARRRHQVKVAPMNIGYIAVMAAALLAVCGILMSYVKLQSDITIHVNNISRLESELNDLKLSNDEMYTKIVSSVDLEEIKRIAVNELGMKYAKEGQVITYSGEGSDYVRQYSDIPTK